MLFNNSKAVLAKFCVIAIALTIVGCEPAKPTASGDSGHSHEGEHAHAETLADAVKELEGACAAIKSGFDKNDANAADEALHDAFHVVEEIEELAKASKLDETGKGEVKTAVKNILDAFDAIHAHGGTTTKTYADVAESIETALKTLVEKAKG